MADDILWISASQLEDKELCPRKWWWKRVYKMPEPPKNYLDFGTVLHSCLERYLRADGTGRDPATGRPVEVFPAGWEQERDRGGNIARVDGDQAQLIVELVNAGIEQGVVQRLPGRTVEDRFELDVLAGVRIVGLRDLTYADDWTVEDHKTSKSPRYLKRNGPKDGQGRPVAIDSFDQADVSPNCVGLNQQMLTYACSLLIAHRERGGADPTAVRVVHNQFLKVRKKNGKPDVRRVEAWVTPCLLDTHWSRVQDHAAELMRIRELTDWRAVPGPTRPDACTAYGGCDWQNLCAGVEVPEMFRLRVSRMLKEKDRTEPKRNSDMTNNIFESAGGGAPVAPPAINPPVAQQPPAQPPPPADGSYRHTGPPAPWSHPQEVACQGTGWNSNGNPCRVCDGWQQQRRQAGQPSIESSMFQITTGPDGQRVATPREGFEAYIAGMLGQSQPTAAAPQPTAAAPQPTAAAPQPAAPPQPPAPPSMPQGGPPSLPPMPASQEAPPVAQAPAAPPPEEKTKSDGKAKAGKGKRRTVTVLVNCLPVSAPGEKPVQLEAIMAELLAQVGVDYFRVDAFARRDHLAREAGTVMSEFSGTIVACERDPDTKAFLTALLMAAERDEGVNLRVYRGIDG